MAERDVLENFHRDIPAHATDPSDTVSGPEIGCD
jgi:hypothetical protein